MVLVVTSFFADVSGSRAQEHVITSKKGITNLLPLIPRR